MLVTAVSHPMTHAVTIVTRLDIWHVIAQMLIDNVNVIVRNVDLVAYHVTIVTKADTFLATVPMFKNLVTVVANWVT